ITIFSSSRLEWLVTPELWTLTKHDDPANCITNAYQRYPQRDFVTRTTATDLQTYLPGDILAKVDIASMAASLECRSPLLDHHVIERAARMPIDVKQTLKHSKKVLSETFSRLIPKDIKTRKKMGFGVPIDHWFRAELRPMLYDILLSSRCLQRGLLKEDSVRQLIDEHTSSQFDHAYRLWNLLCLELWQRMYLDGPPPIAAPTALS
ncbi:MAG: asparagine synthase-related protein, partial [Planctomycetota bacterium]